MSAYIACIDQDDWPGVARLMLASAHKLAAAGADFLICPDNTIHQAMQWVLPDSPLPWLHIADVVAEEAKRRGFQTLGLTGTRTEIPLVMHDANSPLPTLDSTRLLARAALRQAVAPAFNGASPPA